jgi:hypothetical protein
MTEYVLAVFIILRVELFQAHVVVVLVLMRQVRLVVSNNSIAVQNLIGHELALFCLLAFVNFSFFGHI